MEKEEEVPFLGCDRLVQAGKAGKPVAKFILILHKMLTVRKLFFFATLL